MLCEQSQAPEQCQRLQVEIDEESAHKRVKIRVESYDQRLGWYTSGSLSLPLNQLPLLEQAIEQMRSHAAAEESARAKIIPFPALASAPEAQSGSCLPA